MFHTQEMTQQTMICTWLTEIYLNNLNALQGYVVNGLLSFPRSLLLLMVPGVVLPQWSRVPDVAVGRHRRHGHLVSSGPLVTGTSSKH